MCSVEMNKPKRKLTMICAYAPTLPRSNANPALREDFYAELESLVNTVSKRNTLILAGHFNAKTGSGYDELQNNMGKYGKGKLNENGRELLEFACRNDLILTNTMFYHKLSHITTWEGPIRQHTYKHGSIRRNPF